MSKKTRNSIIAVIILAALIVAGIFIYRANKPKPNAGGKALTVLVVHGDKTEKTFEFKTDAENLRVACEEQKLIEGTESEYGLFVTTVDGEKADDTKQEWWAVSKDGEMLQTGVDDAVIADGEKYEFTLTVGW